MRYSLVVFLMLAAACRDRPSGLDEQADSVAAVTPIAADTVRTSTLGGRRLEMLRDTVIEATADSAALHYLRDTRRMGLGSGKIALFTEGDLKVFDVNGKFLWATSRYEFSPGQANAAKRSAFGPGRGPDIGDWIEFMVEPDSYAPGAVTSATSIRIQNDSIVVLQSTGVINIFNQTGRVIALLALPRDSAFYFSPTGLTPSKAGWFILRSGSGNTRPQETVARTNHFVQRVSLSNGAIGKLLRSAITESKLVRVPAGSGSSRTLTGRAVFSPVPVAAVANGMFYHSTGEDFKINQYDEYGRLKRHIVVETDRVPVTAAHIQAGLDRMSQQYRERLRSGDSSAALWLNKVLPEIEKLGYPKHRYATSTMWIGDDGSIAVRRPDLENGDQPDSLRVDILGPDGSYRGRVAFPQPGLTLLHFTGSEFYVAERAGVARAAYNQQFASPGRGSQQVTESFRVPEIYYERLLRFEIKN